MALTQFVDAVLRIKGEANAVGTMSKDVDGLATKLGVGTGAAQAFATGVGGVAVATLAAVGAVSKLTLEANRNSKELLAQGLITADQAERIRESAQAIEGARQTWKALGATLAAEVGPAAKDFFTGLQGAALIAGKILRHEAIGTVADLREEVQLLDGALASSEKQWGSYWAAIGKGADDGIAKWKRLVEEQKRASEERARFDAWLGEQERRVNEGRQAGQAAQGGNALNQRIGGNNPQGPQASILDLTGLGTQKLDEQVDEHRTAAGAIVGIWVSSAAQIVSTLSSFFGQSERSQKAWALTSIAINTAAGIMQAIGHYGPTPVGFAAAGVALGIGAIQFGFAAAGKMPGGVGGGGGGGGGFGRDVAAPITRREARLMRQQARNDERDDEGGGRARNRGGGGTTIFALNTRELARELRKLGAYNVAVAGE